MSGNKISDYLAYRTTIKRLLLCVGLWPREQPTIWYRLVLVVQILINICTVITIGNFVRVNSNDVTRATKGVTVMSGFFSSFLKTICIMANRKEADELHQLLDPPFSKLLESAQFSKLVLKEVKVFRNLMRVLGSLLTCSTIRFIITPIILVFHQHKHEISPVKYLLIIPGAYPWQITPNGFVYKLIYSMEAISMTLTVFVAVGIDSLFTFYVFQIVGRFRQMTHRISNINEKNDFHSAIRECVVQHEILMRCRDILEKIYGPIVLWTIIINAIHLCGQIFEFTQMIGISVQQAIFSSAYMIAKFLQTFMYAWAGMRLTEESENYKAAVYAANWHSNKTFMTSVIIMLVQRPMVLTTCKFSIISLDIFAKVVNTAISYFFLLQTIDEE